MKKTIHILSIFLLCFSIFGIYVDVFALHEDVLEGYKQVTVAGTQKGPTNGIIYNKSIKETKVENYFDITLEINTTKKVSDIIDTYNLAVVFVLDRSFTMSYKADDGETRWAKAVNAAVDISEAFANLDGIRMAAVGFSGGKYKEGGNGGADVAYDDTVVYRAFTEPDADNKKFKLSELGGTTGWDNDNTYRGGTNIEAGLYQATKMLNALPSSIHKKIILLSDGVPTFYYNSSGMTAGPGNSNTQDKMAGVPECQEQAISQATKAKDKGIDIYTIGYEIDNLTNQFTVNGVKLNEQKIARDTLTSIATDSTQFYEGSTKSIKEVFKSIYGKIKEYKETIIDVSWVVTDPINNPDATNKYIKFAGFHGNDGEGYLTKLNKTDHKDTASYSSTNDKITWNLKESTYDGTKTIDGVKYYSYKIKYRVRLENENASFSTSKDYYTNYTTTLTYCVITNGILSSNKTINFVRPKVVGYLGTLEFYKKSNLKDMALSGAKFELTHSSDCPCLEQHKHASDSELEFTATSTSTGLVKFSKIPSGHTYVLTEKTAPADHTKTSETYKIKIAYGEVSGGPKNNVVYNDIHTGTLRIRKSLEGNTKNDGLFEVKLEAWHNGKKLSGQYTYRYNSAGEEGTININVDTIKLDKNDSFYIFGLPVGTTYKVTELTTDGYRVKYEVNSKGKTLTPAVCDSSNSCRIENASGSNVVWIYNYAEYEMPATGSSSQLIFGIIGSLLLMIPVIYIGYIFYRERIMS